MLEYAGSKAGLVPILDFLLPGNTRTLVSPIVISNDTDTPDSE